ncbi:hypothetical protein [Tropicimonas sp. IMCC6043]|uniref:hypothetical protein n=1 Tax=Tropicimonas sp. IMCC6043 TaxID=2510645 RepID=UPI00101CDDF2|nr:hypothetical protein [Tropicimonas sp. IMCC6043]RYH08141.1 hypothetical protein EU800_17770 [Tropicimonas sp. IMCC6043]
MIWNGKRGYVFVEVPKTGTSAIASRLLEIDPEARRGEVVRRDGRRVALPVHAAATEIRRALGDEAGDYTFIAFLRDPVELMVSKYHFYRSGRASERSDRGDGGLGLKLRVAFARATPITLWCRLYPFKTSSHFVDDGAVPAVEELGDFARLQSEFLRIFSRFGYTEAELTLPVKNRTDYTPPTSRQRARIGAIARSRCRRDFELYEQAAAR